MVIVFRTDNVAAGSTIAANIMLKEIVQVADIAECIKFVAKVQIIQYKLEFIEINFFIIDCEDGYHKVEDQCVDIGEQVQFLFFQFYHF